MRVLAALAAVLVILRMTGCMERLFFHPQRGPTPPPPGAEAVQFTSSDGTPLFGWFIPAAGEAAAGGTAASVLHVHGNAGNVESHIWFTEYLPRAGFNLLIFDYRGYGASGGRATRRERLIEDTNAALDALLARPDVDPGRVGLYGQSLGGGIALCVMAERPEVRSAVIESAFTSWRGIAAEAVGGDPPGPFARALAALLIRDGDDPGEAVRTIDRPLLILHGEGDSIVPVHHGRDLAAAAPNAELVVLEGGEHNSLRESHPEIERLVVDFFRRTLAAARGPDG